MSRKSAVIVFSAAFLATALGAGTPSGGDYTITIDTIDNGGGFSAGGDFTLHGTIGQPDAGAPSTASNEYVLAGGFWGRILEVLDLIFEDGFE